MFSDMTYFGKHYIRTRADINADNSVKRLEWNYASIYAWDNRSEDQYDYNIHWEDNKWHVYFHHEIEFKDEIPDAIKNYVKKLTIRDILD
jgi:hypothetical protein